MGTYDDFARPEQACTSGIRTLTQPEGDRLCPMGEASSKVSGTDEPSPAFSVTEWIPEQRRTQSTIFVGSDELLHHIAGLGPAPVEDKAGGVPHPHLAGVICIPLPSGRAALVDAEDYPLVRAHSWSASTGHNVTTSHSYGGEVATIFLHRLVMLLGLEDERVVDHIDHDIYDNRKRNLRVCTPQQNCFNQRLSSKNTSGIKGVSRGTNGGWKAAVALSGKEHAKRFQSAEEAEAWAKAVRIELHGEFACHG